MLTPWSSPSQTSNSTSPTAQAKPSRSSSPPLSLIPTVQFLSKSCLHYHQNISRTQPITTAIGLLDDCSSFLSLLAPALQSAQLGSWCAPCTRSSQMMSLRIKSKLLPLTYQTSCYFSGHVTPTHSISCSFHSSHCGHLTFLKYIEHTSTSGLLHILFLFPEMTFTPKCRTCSLTSYRSLLNVFLIIKASLTSLYKIRTHIRP